jgi:galactokinase
LASAPRTDGKVIAYSAHFRDKQSFSRADLSRVSTPAWLNYVKGLLAELRRREVAFPGFDLAMGGDLPVGSGLASSAALLVGLALSIRQVIPFPLGSAASAARPRLGRRNQAPARTVAENHELARLCHRAEVEFVGLNCGMLDPLTCLFAKEAHAVEIDCQSLSVAHHPLYGEVAWVLCDTGVRHQLTDGAYNELRDHCQQAAAALAVPSLRRVDSKMLASRRKALTERQHECASHIVSENQRVIFATRALQQGDFEQFGQYLFQSHDSSRDLLRNSCPELDLLVDLARRHPACLGARLTGGGFGGSTIHLVRAHLAPAYAADLRQSFRERLGYEPTAELLQTADAAGAVKDF